MKRFLTLLTVSTLGTLIGTTTGLSTLESMATQVNTFSHTAPLKTSIGDVLTNTNLGTINTKGADVPTVQQIKNAIKKSNSAVEINSITIASITSTNAQVTGIGEYQGTTNLTFKINKKMSITDVLQNTNLWEIETGNVTPNEKQIREAILVNNPSLVIDAVEISNINNTSATVTGDNVLYTGSVTVIFIVV